MFRAPSGCELIELLGRGSSFEIAACNRAGVRVLAKRPCLVAQGPEAIDRERWALERWRNRGAPVLIDAGIDAAGPYVVETVVAGEPLRNAGVTRGPSARSARLALRLVDIVCDLHAHRIVHADLSPDNVFVTASDDVGLIDFGAAGSVDDTTLPPRGRGTLPYVAPELARSEVVPSIATDCYASAVLIAELVTSEALCQSTTDAARLLSIGEHGHDVELLDRAAGVPAQTRRALADLVAFSASDRAPNMSKLREALQDWVDESSPAS